MARSIRVAAFAPVVVVLAVLAGCRATSSASAPTWNYELSLDSNGDLLELSAELPPGGELALSVPENAEPFIRELRARIDGRAFELSLADGVWRLPASSSTRRLDWKFDARAAGRAIDDADLFAKRGGGYIGSLAAFLVRAEFRDIDPRFRLRARAPSGARFACVSESSADSEWTGELSDLALLPTCAFGAITEIEHAIAGLKLDLVLLEPRDEAHSSDIAEWVFGAEDSVEKYIGRFPVERLLVIVGPNRRRGVGDGTTRGYGGASIYVAASRGSSKRDFGDDWVLRHEMIHLALPSMPREQHWLEEGSTTYLEPIVAARNGRGTDADVWFKILDEYGQGLPEAGDRGLDHTSTWGRTYYGGAIFWLTADVEIRERTKNAKSIRDVFAALSREGGNITQSWPIERVIEVGDRATGTTVLAERYATMKDAPEPRELDSLWKSLGVALDGRTVKFDDAAPLAWVRRAIVLEKR